MQEGFPKHVFPLMDIFKPALRRTSHSLREWLEEFQHCFPNFFSGTRLSLAEECSLVIASKDGIADCFVTVTSGTQSSRCSIHESSFVSFVCEFHLVGTYESIPTHRMTDRTTIPNDTLPPTSRDNACRAPRCELSLRLCNRTINTFFGVNLQVAVCFSWSSFTSVKAR